MPGHSVADVDQVNLIVVRHGQSVGNVAAETAIRDHLDRIDVPARDPDIELSELGLTQAQALGTWLGALPVDEHPDMLWTSPYRRARQTGQLALESAGFEAATTLVDERLRDRDMGITDMMTGRGIREKYPEEAQRREWIGKFYYRPPGGESWADVAGRVRAVMADLRQRAAGHTVLVTAHDVVNLMFCYVAEGMDEEQVMERARTNGLRNAAICRLVSDDASPTGWRVTAYNLDEHLREAGITVTDQPGASDDVEAADTKAQA